MTAIRRIVAFKRANKFHAREQEVFFVYLGLYAATKIYVHFDSVKLLENIRNNF